MPCLLEPIRVIDAQEERVLKPRNNKQTTPEKEIRLLIARQQKK